MSGLMRQAQLRVWLCVFAALTMSCQVLFGDFKVGDRASAGAGGDSTGGSTGMPGGGAGGTTITGPLMVVPTSDLFTSDLGAQAKFYVSLKQKPTHPVTLPIVSQNLQEGTVSPESLTFSVDDWNAPQAVTVTGVHDMQNVGNQPYSVKVGPAESTDKYFAGAVAQVSITNIDNDSAGFFVSPVKGLVTTEAGGQAFFTVVLNSKPKKDVVIAVNSSDETIGTVFPGSLTFTPENFGSPQTVTITGVNDELAGADRPYQITVGPPMSSDESFANLPSQSVGVTNLDNDQAGVMVTLATGIDPSDTARLRTGENGDSATFTVVLNKQPTKDVKIALRSGSNEGVVAPESLTFTALSWAAPQTVTVSGVDNDNIADGNQPYQVTLGPITSEDPGYGKLTTADLPYVNVINIDNDKAAVAVTLLTGLDPNDASQLLTTEKGSSATFSVVLTSKPKAPVQFAVNSTSGEGSVSVTELDFAMDDWNVAQTVTVTGVDDKVKDGNAVYAVRISTPTTDDLAYQKLQPIDVKLVNLDDDVAGLTPPKLLTGVDGGTKLLTTESGGTASFSVSLTSEPKADVKLSVTSSNSLEGKPFPTTLTFTRVNYATAQVVTITGQDDATVDGNPAYTVTVGPSMSDDSNYAGLSQSVKVTNQDNDSAYIVVKPDYNGTTTEAGGAATFRLNLNSQPTANVTLTLTSSNTNEGKVSPASLLFTPSNWSTAQNVTVTGVDEAIADNDASYQIAIKGTNTSDPNYMYSSTTLTLVNKNDDSAGLKVVAAAGLQTTEAGGKVTFTVALNSQPTGTVSVAASSSATKEGTVAPASLSFNASNWSTAQTVTVTGVDDSVADGNQSYTVSIKASGADAKYSALPTSTVSIVNKDDDQVGIVVSPTTCATTPGTTATFTVVLKSQPLGTVSIALSSDTPTEGKVAPASLTFLPGTWNVAQTVTVTGVDDATMGMMTPYKIVTAAAVSTADAAYNGFNAADVACTNTTPELPPVDP